MSAGVIVEAPMPDRAPITASDATALAFLLSSLDITVPFVLNMNRWSGGDLDVDLYLPSEHAPRADRVAAITKAAQAMGQNAIVVRNTFRAVWKTPTGTVEVWTYTRPEDHTADEAVTADRRVDALADADRDAGDES